jgi:NitT/TauT family transport system substrate-binding protein
VNCYQKKKGIIGMLQEQRGAMKMKLVVTAASTAVLVLLAGVFFALRGNDPAKPELGDQKTLIFTMNWYAQAELGGFIQAVEEGFYKNEGLNVEIRQGNAQLSGPTLLVSGGTDFFVGSGFEAVKSVEQGIPVVAVAALFQKDPQVLIAHPNAGHDKLEDLKGKPIMVSASANTSYWPFLAGKFGYTDSQKRPYAFNIAPFLADPQAIQQGYGTSEPYTIEKTLGKKPNVFYLADHGYLPYANTIETTRENVEKRPEMVRKFVSATIKGWESYLKNPQPAFAAIRKMNPEMSVELMNFGFQQIKDMGLVDSGDAKTLGVGAMTHARWKAFHQSLIDGKLFSENLDIGKAYTLDFLPSKAM